MIAPVYIELIRSRAVHPKVSIPTHWPSLFYGNAVGGIKLNKRVYTYHQTNERLASKETLVTYSPFTLLHAIRTKQLIPYVWFDGYMASYVDNEYFDIYEVLIDKVIKFKGFVAANFSILKEDFEQLCLGHKSSISIVMTDKFILDYHYAETSMEAIKKIYLFDYDFRERHSDFPVSIGRLEDLGCAPGITVTRDNLVFLVEDVEKYIDSSGVSKAYDYFTCIKLEDENEELKAEIDRLNSEVEELKKEKNKLHPALDPTNPRFAPEIGLALKINDYVEENKFREGPTALSHTALANEFLELNGVTGREMRRLREVSNSSKKNGIVTNLAKKLRDPNESYKGVSLDKVN